MFKKKLTVKNAQGIHLNPASKIAKLCMQFESLKIHIIKDEIRIDASSVMSILSLELSKGSNVIIEMLKEDQKVLKQIENFFF